MALVSVMYEINYRWPEKTPQLKTSVLNAVCCHFSMPRQYFIYPLLLTFDEHVKCNDSDPEMTKLVSNHAMTLMVIIKQMAMCCAVDKVTVSTVVSWQVSSEISSKLWWHFLTQNLERSIVFIWLMAHHGTATITSPWKGLKLPGLVTER